MRTVTNSAWATSAFVRPWAASVAQALFVTVRTVEMHLSAVYRKLEIASRAGLPAALPK